MSSFLAFLGFEKDFEDNLSSDIGSSIKLISVKKGEVLQKNGDLKAKGFFVKSGLLRSYTIDNKGKEHIFMFGPEGWIVGDMEFHAGAPATLYIDALEDSEIEVIEPSVVEEFFEKIPLEQLPTEIKRMSNRLLVLQKRIIMLMSASVLERYDDFVQTYPHIVQRVPQRMVASYLGVTPEALSKVKSEHLKG